MEKSHLHSVVGGQFWGSVESSSLGGDLTDTRRPSKEYRARILVKLSDDILPTPVLSSTEVQGLLTEALNVGDPDSSIIAVMVDDPRMTKKRY